MSQQKKRNLPMSYRPKKGDLVYLPSNITLIDNFEVKKWISVDEPCLGVVTDPNVNNENIYHRVHVLGSEWYVRTIDTMEVLSSD